MLAIFGMALLSGRDAKTIPSALIDRPAPVFTALPIEGLNAHPYITQLASHDNIQLFGLNYKDTPDAARRFLNKYGNPYQKIGADKDGTIAIDFGVYGVPETYIIDHQGIIRFKHVGPVTDETIKNDLSPLIKRLTKAAD